MAKSKPKATNLKAFIASCITSKYSTDEKVYNALVDGVKDSWAKNKPPPNTESLAVMVGMARRTVNTALNKLLSDGRVQRFGNKANPLYIPNTKEFLDG